MLSTAKTYADEWQKESASYDRQGVYARLSAITPQGKVLEVGSGTGAGTVALAQGREVLCLENNAHVAEVARARVAATGASAEILLDDVCNPSEATVAAIDRFAPEVVTGWLIGTSGEEQVRTVSDGASAEQWPKLYRERIEDALLTPAICPQSVEWVHLVSRGGLPADVSEEVARHMHTQDYDEHVFGPNGFEVVDVQFLVWDRAQSSFPYGDTKPTNAAPGVPLPKLVSLLARRVHE